MGTAGDPVIAAPHLIFVAVLMVAAWIAFPLLTDRDDTPLMFGQTIVLGLLTGGILTAVLP